MFKSTLTIAQGLTMAQSHNSMLEAVQIVVSENIEGSKDKHVIRIVDKHRTGPSLRYILCGENKNLPIFVFSICGRTRTGKSFMLNLMIKYLESKGFEDWKNGSLPSVFEWKTGTESVTRGLWICSKVFKRKNQFGKEVGILLIDNQGLFDGEQSDGVSIAISGISTSLSSYQIFNLKDSISDNDLESIWRHLISDESNLSDSSNTKLVFTVRDYLNEEDGCGLEHGKTYIEAEKIRGSRSHRDMWEGLQKTFPEIMCLLLPFPGDKVRRGKSRDMRDIDHYFLMEVEKFFQKIFDGKSLNDTKKIPSGEQIYETLKNFDGKEADERLSFANVFTEQGNQNKLEFLQNQFDKKLDLLEHKPSIAQSLLSEVLAEAENMFKGNSSHEYVLKLKKFLIEQINTSLEDIITEGYNSAIGKCKNVAYSHKVEWDTVVTRLGYFVGSESDKNIFKENVITTCADQYYDILENEVLPRFESNCAQKTLVSLQGYDEIFVSNEFKKNYDFDVLKSMENVCNAIWLRARESLRMQVHAKLLTYVSALTSADIEWLQKVAKTQFKFYEIFTWNNIHWVNIKKEDKSLLELVGYTVHKNGKKLSEYSEDEMKTIKKISDQIKYKVVEEQITLTCIFILYRYNDEELCEPIFKVKDASGYSFIDVNGRIYKNWETFQNNNKLPDCMYCHPCRGEYNKSQGFQVGFSWSPASSFGHKLVKVLDVAGKVVAIGSAGVLGAAVAFPAVTLITVGGAAAAGVAGGYGILRSAMKIKDKIVHEESVVATDVVEVLANGLSVATAGVTAGALLIASLGKELACAPAIIQGITSLTGLVFTMESNSISYLTLANETSMFLLFNSKSIEGVMSNIRKSYDLPSETSSLETMKAFISKNSIIVPKRVQEKMTTELYLSESLKSLLVTAIMNKPEKRPLQFLRETVSTCNELKPLENAFCESSESCIEKQINFFEQLITLIGKIIWTKKNNNGDTVNFHGIDYHPSLEVEHEVAVAGVCTGLTSIAECSDDERVQQVCTMAREILKTVYTNTNTTDLKDLTAYLKNNSEEVVNKILKMY